MRDVKHGEVFVKREHDKSRAEAELSTLVRLRFVMCISCSWLTELSRGIPGVVELLHTELHNGDRLFVFPVLKRWKPRMHAQSLARVQQFCRQLFEVRSRGDAANVEFPRHLH